MRQRHSLTAYIVIGIGMYFLLRGLDLPILSALYSWTVLLIIIGFAFLIHSYMTKDYDHLFTGAFLFGLGIHLFGLGHYTFWINHWGIYPFITGAAFIIRAAKTKKGFFSGVLLSTVSVLIIFSNRLSDQYKWIHDLSAAVESYWPLILIGIGIWLLKRK
ncbi:hypothetical protein EU245_01260 [Lentibacillus lipolyticus]|nr:hypothetical protein EU245_01260 [Lentibacillus lipolyticus]